MTVWIPVTCCRIARPTPTTSAARTTGCSRSRQAPAALRRRHLGDVDGGGGRGEADRETDHHPGERKHLESRSSGTGKSPGDEDRRGEQDHRAAPVAVRRRPRDPGPHHGADRYRGYDQTLLEAAEIEVALDEEQSPGDDAGVVAEKQPAESGDRRRKHHVAPRPAARRIEPVAHPKRERICPFGRGIFSYFAGSPPRTPCTPAASGYRFALRPGATRAGEAKRTRFRRWREELLSAKAPCKAGYERHHRSLFRAVTWSSDPLPSFGGGHGEPALQARDRGASGSWVLSVSPVSTCRH